MSYKYFAEWTNASNADVSNIDNNLDFHPQNSNTQTANLHIGSRVAWGILQCAKSPESLPIFYRPFSLVLYGRIGTEILQEQLT